ncbi:FAD-dependent monooxygenase [Larkinella rosea]|uniref:FAD-binding domain-containing protein n=1 Tax=Larkinella rosea TaxID=2025312 RepID=A0A3P1BAR2_9BACT|nr:FAD-dependent monooxygenase [Larkinella rosea]RRA98099.1 hypothetical protein EHT25_31005 [Larkinella rosea]
MENEIQKHQIVIAGAGLVGLTLALLLAKKGQKVVLIDEKKQASVGSRAICFSRKTLEIFDKIDVADAVMKIGVRWHTGRIFFQDKEVDKFEVIPNNNAKFPSFINISQQDLEEILLKKALSEKYIDIKLNHTIHDLRRNEKVSNTDKGLDLNSIVLVNDTKEVEYYFNFLLACDGSKSPIRNLLGLQLEGERFEDEFLIIDFRMDSDFPSERWFWFSPLYDPESTILLHKQPHNIWRIDFKLGKNIDRNVIEDKIYLYNKIKNVVGDKEIEILWVSKYKFSCKMLPKFVYNSVVFAGDSAHVFSPFGARGANSGIQDADNLAWKLHEILNDNTANRLLNRYNSERTLAARQNLECTINSTLFISPPSKRAESVRNQLLIKASSNKDFRNKINCGRLSVPNMYNPLPDSEEGKWDSTERSPGNCAIDCFIESAKSYLVESLPYDFTILVSEGILTQEEKINLISNKVFFLEINLSIDKSLCESYELTSSSAYLFTPDQYILGRWKDFEISKVLILIHNYKRGKFNPRSKTKRSDQELIDFKIAKKLLSV